MEGWAARKGVVRSRGGQMAPLEPPPTRPVERFAAAQKLARAVALNAHREAPDSQGAAQLGELRVDRPQGLAAQAAARAYGP